MRRVTPTTLPGVVAARLEDIFQQVTDRVETGVQTGEKLVKEYISTRGTAKSGKAGRIETGTMLRSVRSRMIAKGSLMAHGRFGMGGGPKYSIYQELGFKHNRSGAQVEGMFAVVDAREAVYQYLIASIRTVR